MSLNWDITRIKDKDSVCWKIATADDSYRQIKQGEQYLNPVTEALIFRTMIVGIGEITERNAGNFYCRSRLLDAFGSHPLSQPTAAGVSEPRGFTIDEVRAHIGLRTNVIDENETAWRKRIVGDQMRNFEREIVKANVAAIEAGER
jgi:hypothetical protein